MEINFSYEKSLNQTFTFDGKIVLQCMMNDPKETMELLLQHLKRSETELLAGLDLFHKFPKKSKNGAAHFQIYGKETIPIAVRDRIRITQNGWDESHQHRLSNGSIHEVKAIHANEIELKNGVKINAKFGHLTHGYCVTSHIAQSKTVDRVFIAENAWSARVAGSREQFYVSVSRGREEVKIYTDDKRALLEGIAPSSARLTAHELIPPSMRMDILEQIRQQYRQELENPAEAEKQKEAIVEKIAQRIELTPEEKLRHEQSQRLDFNPRQSRGIRPSL